MSLGIIGGTGALELVEETAPLAVSSGYGEPSAPPVGVRFGQTEAVFIARHGIPHHIAPHRVNYRANIDSLRQAGVSRVIGINAVGGIDPELPAGALVLPDQLIDYTWGRVHTFSDDPAAPLAHIEFAEPFAGPGREALLDAAERVGVGLHPRGCYAVTQGPRLETAAEISRLAADGCTLVGMTAMPEAALAREAGLDYACLCVVANPAAGVGEEPISIEAIHRELAGGMQRVKRILEALA